MTNLTSLKELGKDVVDMRKRINNALEREFPGISVVAREFRVGARGQVYINVKLDSKERAAVVHRYESMGVTLGVPAGPYEFISHDSTQKKPFTLHDRRDNKYYQTSESFVIEHFSRGVSTK